MFRVREAEETGIYKNCVPPLAGWDQEQINGGVKEDCEVLIPGEGGRMVPYTFANNAARINAGLEIISVLAEHWNTEMPVFIDNAESVTHLADTWMQTIRLVVSEQDKQLRLEAE